MKFKGDIIITDPAYIFDGEHLETDLEEFGFSTYLYSSTMYGDWSCMTIKDSADTEMWLSKLKENYENFFKHHDSGDKSKEEADRIYEEYESRKEELLMKSNLSLGRFCADAGLVGVFLLDEVLEHNPEFDYHITKNWTTTLINNFDGDIDIKVDGDEVKVVGKGNINFFTMQEEF
jgi:hypothetical protein